MVHSRVADLRKRGHSIDQRSDLYSACVLFNELLSLQHYLHGQTTLEGVLTTIKGVIGSSQAGLAADTKTKDTPLFKSLWGKK